MATGTLSGMAALRDALRKNLGTGTPPRLRAASRSARSCGSCKYYKALGLTEGACRLYGGYRVKGSQTCDSWAAP